MNLKSKKIILVLIVFAIISFFAIEILADELSKAKEKRKMLYLEIENLKQELESYQAELSDKTQEKKEIELNLENKYQHYDSYKKTYNMAYQNYQNAKLQKNSKEEKYNKEISKAEEVAYQIYINSQTIKVNKSKETKNILSIFEDIIYAKNILSESEKVIYNAKDIYQKALKEESSKLDIFKEKEATLKTIENSLNVEISRKKEVEKEIDNINMIIEENKIRKEEIPLEIEENLDRIYKLQSSTKSYTGGDMIWPLKNYTRVTSEFGNRFHPIYHVWKLHKGIDIAAPYNAQIIAANDGIVESSGYISGYGYTVIVDHGGGISTLYAHCNRLLKKAGDLVFKGDVISLIGSTGASTGPHLHFEVRINGRSINPREYISPY